MNLINNAGSAPTSAVRVFVLVLAAVTVLGTACHRAPVIPAGATDVRSGTGGAAYVNLTPIAGRDFRSIYLEAVGKARAQNLTPFVEFSSEDCGPCVRLQKILDTRPIDPKILEKFQGTFLIVIKAHEWLQGSIPSVTGIKSIIGIPVFFAIDTAGRAGAHTYGIEWITGEPDISQPDGVPGDRAFFQNHLWTFENLRR